MVMLGSGGNYLKADNCKKGDIIEFLDEGEWVASSKFKYDDGNPVQNFQMKVRLNDTEEYTLTVNTTNRNVLIPAWGNDTAEWINRKAKIEIIKVSVGGKVRNSILLKPLDEQGQPVLAAQDNEVPF